MTSQSRQAESKEVKCTYEWIVTVLSGDGLCSPKFCSQSPAGLRKLEWRIEVSPANSTCDLCLHLLTDIGDDEELSVNYSLSVEEFDCVGQVIYQDTSTNTCKFKRGREFEWSKFFIKPSSLKSDVVHLEIKCELSYEDAILLMACQIEDGSCEGNDKYLQELSESFGHLLADAKFSDVSIFVKGREFKAHKNVISIRSPVLAAMFEHETKEKLENRVEMEDMEPEVLQEMLNFIYTGRVPNLSKMAQELLMAADRYELKGLMKMAEKHLISNISFDNAMKLLVLADMHSASNLYKVAIEFVAANVKKMKLTEDWKMMVKNKPRLMDPIMSEVVKRLP